MRFFSLTLLLILVLLAPFAPFNSCASSASTNRHLLKITMKVIDDVKVYFISLDPSCCGYVYKNFYVFVENVHANKSMEQIRERDWKAFKSLIGNFSPELSPGISSWLEDYGIKARFSLPINSTSLLVYVYRDSAGLLNDTYIISALKKRLKNGLGMNLKSVVFFIYPLTEAQSSLYNLFVQRMNESKEELLRKYGILGFGVDAMTGLPVIRVDSNKVNAKGVSQEGVLRGISDALGNLNIPIEVIFSNSIILPAVNPHHLSRTAPKPLPLNSATVSALITVIALTLIIIALSNKRKLSG